MLNQIMLNATDWPPSGLLECLTNATWYQLLKNSHQTISSTGSRQGREYFRMNSTNDGTGTAFCSDIDLVAGPADPRNLFGLLTPKRERQAA